MNPLSSGIGNYPTSPTAQQLLTLQDFNIEIDATLKELRGQYQFPDDVATGDRKITWKSGYGRTDMDFDNNIIWGESAINTGGEEVNVNETHTIPASSPYSISVTNSANWVEDMGVIYTTGTLAGQKLTRQPTANPTALSGTVPGSYYVASGSYLFAAGDVSLGIEISYTSTVTTGRNLLVQNHTQGWGPYLEIYASNPYQELTAGIPNYVRLYNCKVTKTGKPFKRSDHLITPVEGEAFANSSGYVARFFED
jgi:hypothetical protein